MKKIITLVSTIAIACGLLATSTSFATVTDSTSELPAGDITLEADLNSNNEVELSWSITDTAPKGFKIAISKTNPEPTYPVMSGDSYKYLSSSSQRSYTHSDVLAGKTYYYRICLYQGSGVCGTYSNAVSVTIPGTSSTGSQDSEIDLVASLNSENKVELSWDVSGEAPNGFKLAKSDKNSNPTYPVMSGDSYKYFSSSTTRSYTDTAISAGKTYYYRVCFYNGDGTCGTYSNTASITIPVGTSEPGEIKLAASINSGNKVELVWSVVGSASKGFKLAKSDTNTNPTYPVMEGDSYEYFSDNAKRSYTDDEVELGKTYYYRVCFYEGGSCGIYSNAVAVTLGENSENSEVSGSVKVAVPPAGFEDEVITKYDIYDNPFLDTNLNNLEGVAAAELYRRGIIGGYADGDFKGLRLVNRAEAAKFLLLAKEVSVPESIDASIFDDVKIDEWYAPFVEEAAKLGIINGYPDGYFRPGDQVNTAEFLKMLVNTFDLEKNLSHSYADVSSSDWYAQFAGVASKYDLFPDRNSSYLHPGRELTRDETAVAIYQFLKNR